MPEFCENLFYRNKIRGKKSGCDDKIKILPKNKIVKVNSFIFENGHFKMSKKCPICIYRRVCKLSVFILTLSLHKYTLLWSITQVKCR